MPQPKQDRAIRTRHTILMAAATVFEERGYQAATISEILTTANVTKGALYFHFKSKEQLAQGVLAGQDQNLTVPPQPCKTQELIDTTMLHAHRLQTDPLVRAGVRLTLDQRADGLDRTAPFHHWTTIVTNLLTQAQQQGELLPHVNPQETAQILVGAFAGIQAMSQATTNYQNLPTTITTLLKHTLPTITHPATLTTLNLTPNITHLTKTNGNAISDEDDATEDNRDTSDEGKDTTEAKETETAAPTH
ncbi:ScbR family autoregulator-binding transcription factor [Streptomyces sp. NBC_01239]|uniref:ScbR family autoregulator-binding transcription factor n=1 Tax=Streptomyces sp. NBC_01239 TaxID=2903792 RepID=UPI00225191D5|nr:ScbR family autoregulator-binding transcription factor [Streptomyces sp. NBC_01239]MCX4818063.1 ScbR family autoregulator-binding transcription factor [Streptomyces sp. NBC_01239]